MLAKTGSFFSKKKGLQWSHFPALKEPPMRLTGSAKIPENKSCFKRKDNCEVV